jgi:hypothetical protein
MSRQNKNQLIIMEQTPSSNPQTNPFATMHKQRLYSLVIAGAGFITMLLPWLTFSFFVNSSANGFRSWGWLSFLGIAAVAASVFLGNKQQRFDSMFKNVVMAGFGAMALGALIFFIRFNGLGLSAGFGLWACLVVGLAGLAFIFGLVKTPANK